MTGLTSFSNSATRTRGARVGGGCGNGEQRPRRPLRRRPGLPVRGPPRPDSSCKDSVKRGARALVAEGGSRHPSVERPPCPDACSSSSDSSSPCRRPRFAQEATIVSRDVPLAGERTLASASAPARFDLVGIHWRGRARVQFRTRSTSGRWSAWEDAAPEAEDRPDAGTAERARAKRLAARQPVVGRAVRPDRVPAARPGHAACARGSSRARPPGSPRGRCRRRERPRSCRARGWNADEKIRRAGPSFAAAPADRARPPHRRRERLHRRAGAGDREGDPALPREGERLERHRLQLPRRPLRHRLRGPLRRDRAQRRRRARGGVQHRLGRGRRARRVQLARGHRRRLASSLAAAARLAARPRARRPGDDAIRSSLAATPASPPGCPSSSAPSPATATRASPTARARRSTTC